MALLPFVDEDRLRKALAQVYPDLTPDESKGGREGGKRQDEEEVSLDVVVIVA